MLALIPPILTWASKYEFIQAFQFALFCLIVPYLLVAGGPWRWLGLTSDEPFEIEAMIEGKPLGMVGRLTAKSITKLEDAGSDTRVTYSVQSTLAGKLGSIGQPVLRAKAKDMEKKFTERLHAAFAAGETT